MQWQWCLICQSSWSTALIRGKLSSQLFVGRKEFDTDIHDPRTIISDFGDLLASDV